MAYTTWEELKEKGKNKKSLASLVSKGVSKVAKATATAPLKAIKPFLPSIKTAKPYLPVIGEKYEGAMTGARERVFGTKSFIPVMEKAPDIAMFGVPPLTPFIKEEAKFRKQLVGQYADIQTRPDVLISQLIPIAKQISQSKKLFNTEKAISLLEKRGLKFKPDITTTGDKINALKKLAEKDVKVGDWLSKAVKGQEYVYGGGPKTPSGKEIADIVHRFKLTSQQAKNMAKGEYTGLASEVTQAIREATGGTPPSPQKILGIPKEKITIQEKTALKRSLTRQQTSARESAIFTKRQQKEISQLSRKIKEAPIQNMYAEERIAISELVKQLPKTRTVEGLRKLYSEVSALKEAGKQKYIETSETENAKFDIDKAILLKTSNITPSTIKPIGLKAEMPSLTRETLKTSRAITLRPMRIFDALDGGQNFQGPHHDYFYKKANDADDLKLRGIEKRQVDMEQQMKQIGLTNDNLSKTRSISGHNFTVDEMLTLYTASKNNEKALAIIHGNKIPFPLMNQVVGQMTPQEKALGDAIINDYQANYPRVRKSLLDYTNGKTDLGEIQAYTPIRRTLQGYEPTEKELAKEIMERENLRKSYARREFTKERLTNISPEFQKPIRLGEMSIWSEQMEKQEHFITHGKLVKEMQKMVHDKDFSESVRNKLGQPYLTSIENWVNRVANPSIYKAYTQFEKTISTLRQNAAVSYLGINVLTMLKQFPSLFLFLRDTSPQELLSGIYELSTDYKSKIKMIDELAPQMKHRSIERELEEFKIREPNKWRMMMKKFGNKSMTGIIAMDKYVTHAGWLSVFNSKKATGLSDVEAANQATMSVMRTQPAARAKDIADLYAMGELTNVFTQFSNQLNQIYNIVTYDIPTQFRTGRYEQGIRSATGVAMSAALIALITQGRTPKDLKEAGEWSVEQILNWIPLFGRGVTGVMKGYDFTSIPAFSGFEKASRSLGYTMKGKPKKAGLAGLEAGATLSGIPFSQPKRTIKGVGDIIKKGGSLKGLIYGPRKGQDKKSKWEQLKDKGKSKDKKSKWEELKSKGKKSNNSTWSKLKSGKN